MSAVTREDAQQWVDHFQRASSEMQLLKAMAVIELARSTTQLAREHIILGRMCEEFIHLVDAVVSENNTMEWREAALLVKAGASAGLEVLGK